MQNKIYRILIVPDSLSGCKTWSLAFKINTQIQRVPEYTAEEDILARWMGHVARMEKRN